LPPVFPWVGIAGRDSWGFEVVLVKRFRCAGEAPASTRAAAGSLVKIRA